MPIRVVPFEAITEAVIVSLKDRRVREDRTLDFKREFDLSSQDGDLVAVVTTSKESESGGGTGAENMRLVPCTG